MRSITRNYYMRPKVVRVWFDLLHARACGHFLSACQTHEINSSVQNPTDWLLAKFPIGSTDNFSAANRGRKENELEFVQNILLYIICIIAENYRARKVITNQQNNSVTVIIVATITCT